MDVIPRVTGIAVRGGFLEALCYVALTAGRGNMQSKQRVIRQVVLEGDIAPLRAGMTLLAGLLHGRAMRIVGAVTAGAVRAELLNTYGCRVAGMAVEPGMRSREREFCMFVASHPPQIIAMTICARGAEAALMAIVSLVATGAVLRDGRM
jgi:hypothetical protein